MKGSKPYCVVCDKPATIFDPRKGMVCREHAPAIVIQLFSRFEAVDKQGKRKIRS